MTAISELDSRIAKNTIHHNFLHKYLVYEIFTLASDILILREWNIDSHSIYNMLAYGCVSAQVPGVAGIFVVG